MKITKYLLRQKKSKILLTYFIYFCLGTAASQRCSSPDQYPGNCVELDQCQSVSKLRFKSPISHLDRLYVSLSQCGFSNGKPMVCCTKSPFPMKLLGETENQPTPAPQTTTTTRRPWLSTTLFQVASTTPQTLPIFRPTQETIGATSEPASSECSGIIDNRIFGGSNTRINEMPFTALLSYTRLSSALNRGTNSGFFCGGALISSTAVLTAAHCTHDEVTKQKQWKLTGVRLGEWNLETNPDCDNFSTSETICAPPAIDLTIEEKIMHEGFVPFHADQANDIAILKLRGSVEFNDFVKPICLPNPFTAPQEFNEVSMVVAGFGKTEYSENSAIKLRTDIRGISNEACQQYYVREQLTIFPTQMCALGEVGKDSCNGDSGQPLLYVNTNSKPPRWELGGIVSFGPSPCGQESKPGVYTRVQEYLPWIRKNMN